MAALPAVPNVARIVYHHTLGTDSNVVNANHCRFTGTTDEASLNNWALAITNSWVTHIAPLVSSALVLNAVEVVDLTSNTAAEGSNVANHPGTGAVPAVPANVALVISYQINRRYRGGRPRQYMAGLSANELSDEDHWLTTTINSWEAAYELHQTTVAQFSGGSVTASAIVNVGYYSNHTWEQDQHGNWHKIPTLLSSPHVDVVNGYIAQPIVGTQRRRAQA